MSNSVERKPQPDQYSSGVPHAQLRLALGSILNPKRPSYSRSPSGTASPAPFAVPPPPAPTPTSSPPTNRRRASSHLREEEHMDDDGDESDHIVPPALIHSHVDHDHDHDHDSPHSASGSGTPRARFIETLQGKKAWDALIHGSFS